MNIELPPTITARYEPDTWTEEYYDTNGTGTVYIEFGGWPVMEIRIDKDGERFENSNSYYQSAERANEELSEFVAKWLKKVFENALSVG